MPELRRFLLDANVFIEAKQRYYTFDICPGFWKSLIVQFESGNLCSVDNVRQELLREKDELEDWVANEVPDEFFKIAQDQDVIENYAKIMLWVNEQEQFFPYAKADFARCADGWLIAYAWAKDCVVVTHEQFAGDVRKRVPIPNVCEHFGLEYKDTFFMLKALNIKFD